MNLLLKNPIINKLEVFTDKNRQLLYWGCVLILLSAVSKMDVEYKWSHLYFDYEHGFLKRGLVGQLFHCFYLPQDLISFVVVSTIVLIVVALVYYQLIKDFSVYEFLLLACLFLFSPLLFKNLVYDIGRYDQIGIIFVFLQMYWLNKSKLKYSKVVFCLSPVLLLIHEGMILWILPIMICIAFQEYPKLVKWVIVAAVLVEVSIVLWGGLDIDIITYEADLYTWAQPYQVYGIVLATLTRPLEAALYESISGLSNHFMNPHGLRGVLLICSMIIPITFIKNRKLMLWAMLTILSSSLFYVLGVDHYRWMALQGLCCMIYLIYAIRRNELIISKNLLIYLITICVISVVMDPIGIWRV